ncbi:MAG TPA: isoaspartyl peptidase/L-asparaginase [Oligoflexus sp.]|uniref:isoaspartyl peptidase/L-asparaginase family protein n=1 Tax=Oligoflexus sp. TaxID=1971216 RepID=UPI002D25A354|nr:isoaspartyl peptidase/L-asparaginase [Oligoflexus sp.]HYX33877.1 isoaspartyl peptidase/L-asparaginase [Oligoflexus sp.]
MIKSFSGLSLIPLLTSSALMAADAAPQVKTSPCQKQQGFAAIVHGGAGDWDFKQKNEAAYRRAMEDVMGRVHKNLQAGGTAVDAVAEAIVALEDNPLFNAGRGAIANSLGKHELDASIMDGTTLKAGAVAAVTTIKNPILAARAVMDQSEHVLLVAGGAEDFASKRQIQLVKPDYFDGKEKDKKAGYRPAPGEEKFGTVGAAVLDRCGNLASGTSTGGFKAKLPGRVGDSPIIGAGTYADNRSAAISATGHGEYFIRYAVAHDITARMRYQGLSLPQAADTLIKDELLKAGGSGGIIAVDRNGKTHASYNSRAMLHATVHADGKITVRFQ